MCFCFSSEVTAPIILSFASQILCNQAIDDQNTASFWTQCCGDIARIVFEQPIVRCDEFVRLLQWCLEMLIQCNRVSSKSRSTHLVESNSVLKLILMNFDLCQHQLFCTEQAIDLRSTDPCACKLSIKNKLIHFCQVRFVRFSCF